MIAIKPTPRARTVLPLFVFLFIQKYLYAQLLYPPFPFRAIMFYKVKLANFFDEMDNQIMHKNRGLAISLLSLPFLCLSLTACSSEKDDGKTYSFQVNYYNDIHEKVGFDYVAYGKASRSVRPIADSPSYDYISRSSLPFSPGTIRKFKGWEGVYLNNDPSLPAYQYQPNEDSPKRTVPQEGDEANLTNILGDCDFIATFANAPIEFKTIFYNGQSSIKKKAEELGVGENPSTSFGADKIYRLLDLGGDIAVPSDITKDVGYGYHSSFLGFGFSDDASLPFLDFSSASFLYGSGEPSSLTDYSALRGSIAASLLTSGSIYQDVNALDEKGNHVLSLYGYDGAWHELDCSLSTPTIKLYSVFSSPSKNEYNVTLFSDKYADSSSLNVSMVGHYGDEITFDASNKQLTVGSSTVDTSEKITKDIRTWIAVYSSAFEKYNGVSLDKSNNNHIYLSADLSLYPVYYDCKVKFGEETAWIKFGNKITETKEGNTRYVYSFSDSKGERKEFVSVSSLHATYSNDDLSLSSERKGMSCLFTDAILGDIELH